MSDLLSFLNQDGGAAKKRKAAPKKKVAPKKKASGDKKKAPCSWKATGRTVVIKGVERKVYKHGDTGKLAYRKKVAGVGGKPGSFRHVPLPAAGTRGGASA